MMAGHNYLIGRDSTIGDNLVVTLLSCFSESTSLGCLAFSFLSRQLFRANGATSAKVCAFDSRSGPALRRQDPL